MSSVILVAGASSRFDASMVRALAHCARLVRNILFACAWPGASIAHATPGGGHGAPPFVGQSFDLTYSNGFRVVDEFATPDELRFTVLSPPTPGRSGTVHIDDFNKDISRSYYVPAGGTLIESWAPLRRAR